MSTTRDLPDTMTSVATVVFADLTGSTGVFEQLGNEAATRVITGTEQDFVSSLNSLTPVLHQLAAAGQNLPRAMKVALSFPFPVGKTTDMIRGDYANLHLYLDFNLTNELCGLNKKLCNLAPAGADGAAATPLSTDSSGASSLQPALIGVGG